MTRANLATLPNIFSLIALVLFIVGAVLFHTEHEWFVLFLGLSAFTLSHFAI